MIKEMIEKEIMLMLQMMIYVSNLLSGDMERQRKLEVWDFQSFDIEKKKINYVDVTDGERKCNQRMY